MDGVFEYINERERYVRHRKIEAQCTSQETVDFMRRTIWSALTQPEPGKEVQTVITHERKESVDKQIASVRISMLRVLKNIFKRRRYREYIAQRSNLDAVNDLHANEMLEEWQSSWEGAEKIRATLAGIPWRPSLTEALETVDQPWDSFDVPDDPEEVEAYEHASACNCGYMLQRMVEHEMKNLPKDQYPVLQEMQAAECKPINFFGKNEWMYGFKEAPEIKERLQELQREITNPWTALRSIIELLANISLAGQEPLITKDRRIYAILSQLRFIDRLAARLPFVDKAPSVQKFCKIFVAAWQQTQDIASQLQDLQDQLKAKAAKEFLQCNTPQEYIAFIEILASSIDQFCNKSWLEYESRNPTEQGGVNRDLHDIYPIIRERFGDCRKFKLFLLASENNTPKSIVITTADEAHELLIAEANRLEVSLDELLSPKTIEQYLSQSPLLRKAIKFFADQQHEAHQGEAGDIDSNHSI